VFYNQRDSIPWCVLLAISGFQVLTRKKSRIPWLPSRARHNNWCQKWEIRRSVTEKTCKKYYGNQGRHVSQGKGTADGNQTRARKQFTHIHTRQPSTSKTEEPSSELGQCIEPSPPSNIEGSAVPAAERQHLQIRIEQPPRDRPVNETAHQQHANFNPVSEKFQYCVNVGRDKPPTTDRESIICFKRIS